MTKEELNATTKRHHLVLESTRTVAAEFVEIRLAIALAFARLCVLQSSNHNSEKALESRGLAQEGLNIALEFMNRARFTDWKLKEVTDQIMAVEKPLYLS